MRPGLCRHRVVAGHFTFSPSARSLSARFVPSKDQFFYLNARKGKVAGFSLGCKGGIRADDCGYQQQ
jgi:hypothetical protein